MPPSQGLSSGPMMDAFHTYKLVSLAGAALQPSGGSLCISRRSDIRRCFEAVRVATEDVELEAAPDRDAPEAPEALGAGVGAAGAAGAAGVAGAAGASETAGAAGAADSAASEVEAGAATGGDELMMKQEMKFKSTTERPVDVKL